MVLSEKDRGRTVTVTLGSTVAVRLSEIPGGGYRWQVEDAGGLELAGEDYDFQDGGAIGGAVTHIFEFRAVRVGVHRLRLKNEREWSGEVADRFQATIVVRV